MTTKKTTKTKASSSKKGAKKPAKAAKKPVIEAADQEAKPKKKAAPAVKRNPMVEQTFFAKPDEVKASWRLIDADGLTLGRLSTYIATALMGKDKPTYTRSSDTGDFIVVVNAEKVVLTGNKWQQKVYKHHTNYPGGLKEYTAQYILDHHPQRLIEKAVWRMLPHGHMGRRWFSKLKVYAGTQHPHTAQQPKPVKVA